MNNTMVKEVHISQISKITELSDDESIKIVNRILQDNPILGDFEPTTQWIRINPILIKKRQSEIKRAKNKKFVFRFAMSIFTILFGIILGPNIDYYDGSMKIIFSLSGKLTALDIFSYTLIVFGLMYIFVIMVRFLGGTAEDDKAVQSAAMVNVFARSSSL